MSYSPFVQQIKLPDNVTYDIHDVTGLRNNTTGAAFHNSIYRGKELGSMSNVVDCPSGRIYGPSIVNGSFDNMFIGDYWTGTCGSYIYDPDLDKTMYFVIAGFDYFLNRGDVANSHTLDEHHVVLLCMFKERCIECKAHLNTSTQNAWGYYQIKNANSLDQETHGIGAYLGGLTYSGGGIKSEATWYDSYTNTVTNNIPSAGAWYETKCDLLTEEQVFGGKVLSAVNTGSTNVWNYSLSTAQFPIFRLAPWMIQRLAMNSTNGIWLRDIYDSTHLCGVDKNGRPNKWSVTSTQGVVGYTCVLGRETEEH